MQYLTYSCRICLFEMTAFGLAVDVVTSIIGRMLRCETVLEGKRAVKAEEQADLEARLLEVSKAREAKKAEGECCCSWNARQLSAELEALLAEQDAFREQLTRTFYRCVLRASQHHQAFICIESKNFCSACPVQPDEHRHRGGCWRRRPYQPLPVQLTDCIWWQ